MMRLLKGDQTELLTHVTDKVWDKYLKQGGTASKMTAKQNDATKDG